ncbi:MAG: AAA family ATPase [Defluviimonas sp.]|nr:AAA family ATPase [Defluviimonas sp.]
MHDLRSDDILYLRSIPAAVTALGMKDLDDIVRLLTVALLSGGHVLLEGNPGLGKTALVRALSQALGLGEEAVGRIQFTPDLMPADITGTLMPSEEDPGRLVFRNGPIFHELLLADEINRATPKTQSAMLEAMAEQQVTVLGKRRTLQKDERAADGRSVLTPFMVMATQNPVDQDGTFNLPEAQLDRFMFKVRMRMPRAETIGRIIDKELQQGAGTRAPVPPANRRAALDNIDRAARAILSAPLPPTVRAHIINIVMASNGVLDDLTGVSKGRMAEAAALAERVDYPFGPRAAITLGKAVLGWSAVTLTEPEHAHEIGAETRRALADVLVPALRHRIRIRHDYGAQGAQGAEADAIDGFVRKLALAVAPDLRVGSDTADYHLRFKADMDDAETRLRV